MIKKDIFAKCNVCKNLDETKSNNNWRVCKFQPMPLEILINGSDKCEKYEQKDNQNDQQN